MCHQASERSLCDEYLTGNESSKEPSSRWCCLERIFHYVTQSCYSGIVTCSKYISAPSGADELPSTSKIDFSILPCLSVVSVFSSETFQPSCLKFLGRISFNILHFSSYFFSFHRSIGKCFSFESWDSCCCCNSSRSPAEWHVCQTPWMSLRTVFERYVSIMNVMEGFVSPPQFE